MINAWFYDIESLRNIFTLANFKDAEDPANMVLDIYYLCDTPELTSQLGWQARAKDRILERNKNFLGSKDNIHFLDLHKPFCVDRLASEFGCSDAKYINDPDAKSMYAEEKPTFRIVCDTDPEYQANPDAYPYIFGYNSYNYDTTMLAKFLEMSFAPIPREERDENGKKIEIVGKGLLAQAISHEIDHLNGEVFIDKIHGIIGNSAEDTMKNIGLIASPGMIKTEETIVEIFKSKN